MVPSNLRAAVDNIAFSSAGRRTIDWIYTVVKVIDFYRRRSENQHAQISDVRVRVNEPPQHKWYLLNISTSWKIRNGLQIGFQH